MSSIIPIPLPFEKGRDRERDRELPPHLDQSYYDSSPAASSSSTPIPYHPSPLAARTSSQLAVESDQVDGDPGQGYEDEENIFRDMSWEEILEDLNARFLINLPKEEMNLVRVYWQAEQAHWFYEDYLRPLNPLLPSLSQRNFTRIIIESSPLYASLMTQGGVDYDQAWEDYCSYKRMVPCCGGILINRDGDKCLMVRGFKSNAGWSFPRGKINLEESEEACAVREVEEETGFDLTDMIDPVDKIKTHINAQEVTMFIIKGIDEGTVFKTQTRNEIGAIEWVRLMDLPTWINKRGPKRTGGNGQKKFYNVTPFVNPLKSWLKKHGIDPYMKPKKKVQPPSAYRDLQPYQFNSPSPQPSSPVPSRGSSALDHLFARFIHKQEEELSTPNSQAAVGSDNKAGLERLFGNLDVLKEEEESIAHTYDGGLTDKEREKKEDDALARLLAGLGGLQTPAPEPPKPVPSTQKQSNLLAMLNQRPSASSINPLPTQAHPQTQTQTLGPSSPAKPHQAKLLAMFAPPGATNVGSASASTPSKPTSLPTSPRPLSPTQGAEEVQRQAKARALLDMTIAGIGIDVPAGTAHQMDPLSASHPAFLPPLPLPGSAGRTSNTSGGGSSGTGQRITPPSAGSNGGQGQGMPPVHQIPHPSSYHAQTVYRPTSQHPHTTYVSARPPPGPNPNPAGYTGSPNRAVQPPPPYDAPSHILPRGGNSQDYAQPFGGYDPSRAMPNYGNPVGGQAIRPPGPPGIANVQAQQSFRPNSNPLPGPGPGPVASSYGYPNLGTHTHTHQGPHPPNHHLPPSGLQGGFVPPPGPPLAHNYQINQPFRPVVPQGQVYPSQGTYQAQPTQPFPPHLASHAHAHAHAHALPNLNPNPNPTFGQRGSPPKAQNLANPNVFHPVPRPPAGQGAALLAMINGGERGQGR